MDLRRSPILVEGCCYWSAFSGPSPASPCLPFSCLLSSCFLSPGLPLGLPVKADAMRGVRASDKADTSGDDRAGRCCWPASKAVRMGRSIASGDSGHWTGSCRGCWLASRAIKAGARAANYTPDCCGGTTCLVSSLVISAYRTGSMPSWIPSRCYRIHHHHLLFWNSSIICIFSLNNISPYCTFLQKSSPFKSRR